MLAIRWRLCSVYWLELSLANSFINIFRWWSKQTCVPSLYGCGMRNTSEFNIKLWKYEQAWNRCMPSQTQQLYDIDILFLQLFSPSERAWRRVVSKENNDSTYPTLHLKINRIHYLENSTDLPWASLLSFSRRDLESRCLGNYGRIKDTTASGFRKLWWVQRNVKK